MRAARGCLGAASRLKRRCDVSAAATVQNCGTAIEFGEAQLATSTLSPRSLGSWPVVGKTSGSSLSNSIGLDRISMGAPLEDLAGAPDFLRGFARASLPQAQHVDAKGIAASV